MVSKSSFEVFAVVPRMTSASSPPLAWAWQDLQREEAASLFTWAMDLTVLWWRRYFYMNTTKVQPFYCHFLCLRRLCPGDGFHENSLPLPHAAQGDWDDFQLLKKPQPGQQNNSNLRDSVSTCAGSQWSTAVFYQHQINLCTVLQRISWLSVTPPASSNK